MLSWDDERISLKTATNELFDEAENVLNVAFKASGGSVMDMLNISEDEGAMIGAVMTFYRHSKDFAVIQAEVFDKINDDLDEVKKQNEELRKQNDEMQQLLRDLMKEIKKNKD